MSLIQYIIVRLQTLYSFIKNSRYNVFFLLQCQYTHLKNYLFSLSHHPQHYTIKNKCKIFAFIKTNIIFSKFHYHIVSFKKNLCRQTYDVSCFFCKKKRKIDKVYLFHFSLLVLSPR